MHNIWKNLRLAKFWRLIFKSFSRREKNTVFMLMIIAVAGGAFWITAFVLKNTESMPTQGGEYSEGLVGEPLYINPVLSLTNDIDADLEHLIFSRLFTYDNQGNLQSDLVERYEISEDHKIYTIYLKQNMLWEDGDRITTDDIEYTFNLIRNPDYKSPLLLNFRGVEMQKDGEYQIKFTTNNTYAPFLNNLTFGILPKHLWKDTTPTSFFLAEYNLKPIGSGPFKFSKLKKDKNGRILTYQLEQNENYYGKKPYIKKVTFKFYPDEETSIEALNKKGVLAVGSISPVNKNKIKKSNIHSIKLPRYYAVFLNQTKNKALSNLNIRKALALATDKEKIIRDVFNNEANIVNGPLLEGMVGYNPEAKTYGFSIEQAKQTLEDDKWKDIDGDGIREKNNVRAEFTLVTTDLPEFLKVTDILKSNWQEIGVKVNIVSLDVGQLQQEYIKPREYEAILFGEILGLNPDPYSFWHSSQKKDPGLNLAMYDNRDVDKALEQARQTTNQGERITNHRLFQSIIADEIPTVFLYSPYYLHPCNNVVKNFQEKIILSPSYRFNDINEWYIKTKRVWKK